MKAKITDDPNEEISLSQPQRRFLGIAIKYGLLCGIATAFTNIQFCGWLLFNFELIPDPMEALWFDLCWNWLFDVVLFINFYSLWMTFPFGDNHYKVLCKFCHIGCKRFCTFLVIRKMDNMMDNGVVTKGEKLQMSNI